MMVVSRPLGGGNANGSPPGGRLTRQARVRGSAAGFRDKLASHEGPRAGGRLPFLGRISVFGLRLVRDRELVRQAALIGLEGLPADAVPGVAGSCPVHRRDAERFQLY